MIFQVNTNNKVMPYSYWLGNGCFLLYKLLPNKKNEFVIRYVRCTIVKGLILMRSDSRRNQIDLFNVFHWTDGH